MNAEILEMKKEKAAKRGFMEITLTQFLSFLFSFYVYSDE